MHLLVSEFYIYQNARCNDKKITEFVSVNYCVTTTIILCGQILFWPIFLLYDIH